MVMLVVKLLDFFVGFAHFIAVANSVGDDDKNNNKSGTHDNRVSS